MMTACAVAYRATCDKITNFTPRNLPKISRTRKINQQSLTKYFY